MALLLADGNMQIYDIQNYTIGPVCSVSMFSEELEALPELGNSGNVLYADALIQSGNNIAALRDREISLWEREENNVVSPVILPATKNLQASLIIPASLGGVVITYQSAFRFTKLYPESSFNPLSFLPVSGKMRRDVNDRIIIFDGLDQP